MASSTERRHLTDLFDWALERGAIGLEQVKVEYFQKGTGFVRGLAAARDLSGPVLLPRSLLLTAESAPLLALRLVQECQRTPVQDRNTTCHDSQQAVSLWAPWIRTLPSEQELFECHLGYADAALLEAFSSLPIVGRVREWNAQIAAQWEELVRDGDAKEVSFEEFKWASTIVLTRVFLPPPDYMFMPFADMMNTGLCPNMEVYDCLEVDCDSKVPAPDSYFGLLPLKEQAVQMGEELLQAYRPVDNSERLFRGGFLLEANPVPLPALDGEACRNLNQLNPDVARQQPRLLACLRALLQEHCEQQNLAE